MLIQADEVEDRRRELKAETVHIQVAKRLSKSYKTQNFQKSQKLVEQYSFSIGYIGEVEESSMYNRVACDVEDRVEENQSHEPSQEVTEEAIHSGYDELRV